VYFIPSVAGPERKLSTKENFPMTLKQLRRGLYVETLRDLSGACRCIQC